MHRVLVTATVCLAAFTGCDDTVFGTEVPTYESNWLGVEAFLYNECRTCHVAGGPGFIEDLSTVLPDHVETGESPEADLVIPGDAEASLLWRVISPDYQPRPGQDDPPAMPLDRGTLPLTATEHVFEWIEDGASFDD